MNLYRTPAPHASGQQDVTLVMLTVVAAGLPGMAAQCYFFGWGVLLNVLSACFWALATESLLLHWRGKPIRQGILDGSALVTGFLLGVALPPLAPWWLVMIAVVFAIACVKHLYGGLGFNPFNPAMAGYVLVLVSFPVAMSRWIPVSDLWLQPIGLWDALHLVLFEHTPSGLTLDQLRTGVDGFTLATPLDKIKTDLAAGFMVSESIQSPIFGLLAGKGWGWVNLAYLLGGLFLVWRKIVAWQIPAGFIASLTLLAMFFSVYSSDVFPSPWLHLFSGATMLGAFFIATDPVTASTTPRGRWYFGIGVGILVYLIRTWGGYPDGVAFAVLLMNLAAPTLDHYTVPRPYGTRQGAGG
jgi:electron transport complex protein RnfD